jgi:hypothetical protein
MLMSWKFPQKNTGTTTRQDEVPAGLKLPLKARNQLQQHT